jgi:hypothetical protein
MVPTPWAEGRLPKRTNLLLKLISMHIAKKGWVLALVECALELACCDREIRGSMYDRAKRFGPHIGRLTMQPPQTCSRRGGHILHHDLAPLLNRD